MPRDLNDALRDGDLPEDPFEGGEPMEADPVVEEPAQETPLKLDSLSDVLELAKEQILARKSGNEKPTPIEWEELSDALGGGFWPGVHILVGKTGIAKTQLALQIALYAAQNGSPVLYVGLEMDELQVGSRLLGAVHKKIWAHLYLGECEEADLEPKQLADLPFLVLIQDPHEWSIARLGEAVKELLERYPPKKCAPLVVVDFLQVIGDEESKKQRRELRELIGQAAYQARKLRRKGVATLLISSTARNNYPLLSGTKDKDDTKWKIGEGSPGHLVGTGKESGDIEYSADSVLVLCRNGEQDYLAVAKVRAYKQYVPWVPMHYSNGLWRERLNEEIPHQIEDESSPLEDADTYWENRT